MRNPERAPDATSGSLQIGPAPRRDCVRLKSWLPGQFAGTTLPASTGSTADGAVHTLCLAPGEWLVVGTTGDPLEAHQGVIALNVTDAFAVIRIQGRGSRAVLSKGCGLDFHPSQFSPGTCARTLFAKVSLIVDCVGPECFDLYLGRSYQAYLHAWLTDAALFAHLED